MKVKLFVAEQYAARKNGTRNYTALREQFLSEAREQFPDVVAAGFNPRPEVINKWVRSVAKLRSSAQQPQTHCRSHKKAQHRRPGKSAATKRQWQKEHLRRDGTVLLEKYQVHIPLTLEWIHKTLCTKAVITSNFERLFSLFSLKRAVLEPDRDALFSVPQDSQHQRRGQNRGAK